MRVYVIEWVDRNHNNHQTVVIGKNRDAAWDTFIAKYRECFDFEGYGGYAAGTENIPLRDGFMQELS